MMLSNVLKSKRAIQVSMRIIDVFIQLRESLTSHAELRLVLPETKYVPFSENRNVPKMENNDV